MSEARRIGADARRVAVVQAEGPAEHRGLRALAGVAPFERDGEKLVSIVVRLDLVLAEGGELFAEARPVSPRAMQPDVPIDPPDPSGELLRYASDFALFKESLDLVIVGHARGPAPAEVIEGGVDLLQGDAVVFTGAFSARAGGPTPAIPLRAPYLAPFVAGAASRVAPAAESRRFAAGKATGLEPTTFQAAEPGWRARPGSITPDAALRFRGLFGSQEAKVALPGLEPVVTADLEGLEGLSVPLSLDTIWIDVDEGVGAMSWRGVMPTPDGKRIDRFVLSLERASSPRDEATRLADTQRGTVRYAWTEDDAAKGTPPPEEDNVLTYHKEMTWSEVAPDPRISIEQYAAVSAELAERPKERGEVLAKHGFDDERFMVEERAWLERFAANAVQGKGELAAYYGDLFIAAQDALTTPEEERLTLRDYAGLRAELDRSADPTVPLDRAEVTLAQFMRLERRWTTRADADPAVQAELDALLEELGGDVDPLEAVTRAIEEDDG